MADDARPLRTAPRAADPASAAPAGIALPDAERGLRRELAGWAALGIGALGIAGVFALLLAISRVPGIERVVAWPIGFFHKGLVIHVVFSFVVWFLAVFGALSLLARRQLAPAGRGLDILGWIGVGGGLVALPLLFVPAFLDRGEPTLNNYIPVIIDPLYYIGLMTLAIATGCAALRLLALAVARPAQLLQAPAAACIAAAALAVMLALLCFAAALALLAGTPLSFDFNETLMWGGGHALQFVNTLLLVASWCLIARPLLPALPTVPLAIASGALLLAVLTAPAFYLVFPAFSPEQTQAFTALQYVLGPPAAVLAGALLVRLPRPWPWRQPAFQLLALSMLLFTVGGALGLFVDGADTRTPAHYHGVIASVTLAFFGLYFFVILPALHKEAPSDRRLRLIVHLFAWGQLAACIGLFVAGGHGVPRKVAGEAQGLVDLVPMIGMGLNGLGGLVAVLGGILFVWTVGAALLQPAATAGTGGAAAGGSHARARGMQSGSGLRSAGSAIISRRTRG